MRMKYCLTTHISRFFLVQKIKQKNMAKQKEYKERTEFLNISHIYSAIRKRIQHTLEI